MQPKQKCKASHNHVKFTHHCGQCCLDHTHHNKNILAMASWRVQVSFPVRGCQNSRFYTHLLDIFNYFYHNHPDKKKIPSTSLPGQILIQFLVSDTFYIESFYPNQGSNKEYWLVVQWAGDVSTLIALTKFVLAHT